MKRLDTKKISRKRLLHKYKIDLWGNHIMQRRLKKRPTQRILVDSEMKTKRYFVYKLKKIFFKQDRVSKVRRFRWKFRGPLFNNNPPKQYYPKRPLPVPSSPKNLRTLKNFFYRSLFKYFTLFKNSTKTSLRLERLWMKAHINRLKFTMSKLFGRLRADYLVSRTVKKRRVLIPSWTLASKLELLKQQHYFCFSTLNQIRRYSKRVEFVRKPDLTFLGLEGSFLNLVFRTNLFSTTKQAYAFIKSGAFNMNCRVLRNPYKILSVLDVFNVNTSFIKTIWSIFRKRVKRKLILINIPNHLDFNYKLLSFLIWRLPTAAEKKSVYYYPFFRSTHNNFDVYPNHKNEFIGSEDFKRPKVPRR